MGGRHGASAVSIPALLAPRPAGAGTLGRLRPALRSDLAVPRRRSTRGRPRTSCASPTAKKDVEDPYQTAAATLAAFLLDGTLEKERRPATLDLPADLRRRRAHLRARRARGTRAPESEYADGVVHPHERTLSKPKEDRFELLAATKADLELVFLLTRAPLSTALVHPAYARALGDRPRRRAPRRLSHLGLRGPRRAPGARQERGGDHRRRPPSLRDGARLLEGPGRREASGRPLQAVRDRGHGLRPASSFDRSTACCRASRRGDPAKLLERARAIFDLVEHSDVGAAFDALRTHSRIRPAFVL